MTETQQHLLNNKIKIKQLAELQYNFESAAIKQKLTELFADNANATRVESSSVSNIRLGHNGYYDDWEISSFLGVNNLFDEAYNSNIRINAFGARYYEPAPERNAYIGITVRRRFAG